MLSKFEPAEREQLESVITRAADAAEMFAAEGIVKVMNTHNADDAESAKLTPCHCALRQCAGASPGWPKAMAQGLSRPDLGLDQPLGRGPWALGLCEAQRPEGDV